MPDPSRLGIEHLLGQPREKAAQQRGGTAARGSRQQAPSVEGRWRLTVVNLTGVEGFVDTVVEGIDGRTGSSQGQYLRPLAAAHGGGRPRTARTQPARSESFSRAASSTSPKSKSRQVLGPSLSETTG